MQQLDKDERIADLEKMIEQKDKMIKKLQQIAAERYEEILRHIEDNKVLANGIFALLEFNEDGPFTTGFQQLKEMRWQLLRRDDLFGQLARELSFCPNCRTKETFWPKHNTLKRIEKQTYTAVGEIGNVKIMIPAEVIKTLKIGPGNTFTVDYDLKKKRILYTLEKKEE